MIEYAESPLALGTRAPRFSWDVPLAGRNRRQSAYRILVATEALLLGHGKADLWDSGKVASAQSVNIAYAGKELRSNMDCFWSVQLWDEAGNEASEIRSGRFGTALLVPCLLFLILGPGLSRIMAALSVCACLIGLVSEHRARERFVARMEARLEERRQEAMAKQRNSTEPSAPGYRREAAPQPEH